MSFIGLSKRTVRGGYFRAAAADAPHAVQAALGAAPAFSARTHRLQLSHATPRAAAAPDAPFSINEAPAWEWGAAWKAEHGAEAVAFVVCRLRARTPDQILFVPIAVLTIGTRIGQWQKRLRPPSSSMGSGLRPPANPDRALSPEELLRVPEKQKNEAVQIVLHMTKRAYE